MPTGYADAVTMVRRDRVVAQCRACPNRPRPSELPPFHAPPSPRRPVLPLRVTRRPPPAGIRQTDDAAREDLRLCRRRLGCPVADGHPARLRAHKSSRLTGLSAARSQGQALAAQYGVPDQGLYSYDPYDRIADNPDIDAVYIVLPQLHARRVQPCAPTDQAARALR